MQMSERVPVAVTAFALAIAVLLVAAAPSPAPVEPRNCKMIRVEGDRYQIKADQIRCKQAKRWARGYLARRSRPSGYRCRNFDASTRLEFRCWKGRRVYFAIRR
jgi:hypothetical protein